MSDAIREIIDMTELSAKIAASVAEYNAMSPVDKALHDTAQKQSFVRGLVDNPPQEFDDAQSVLAREVIRLRAEIAAAERRGLEKAKAAIVNSMRFSDGARANLAYTGGFNDAKTGAIAAIDARIAEIEKEMGK